MGRAGGAVVTFLEDQKEGGLPVVVCDVMGGVTLQTVRDSWGS